MLYQFEYKGGHCPIGEGSRSQFLLFLVSGGEEISFAMAKKKGIITPVTTEERTQRGAQRFETDCAVVKLMMNDMVFGKGRFLYSFYMMLSRSSLGRQEIEIKPILDEPRALGYTFKTEGRFLRKSEALQLFSADSMQAKMLHRQQTPAVDLLKQIITITREGDAQEKRNTRHLRIRR